MNDCVQLNVFPCLKICCYPFCVALFRVTSISIINRIYPCWSTLSLSDRRVLPPVPSDGALPSSRRQPKINHWYLVLTFALLRFAFFPLFMYCNVDHVNLVTVFDSDAYYIVFMVLFGLSNGYISTLCMIYGPR